MAELDVVGGVDGDGEVEAATDETSVDRMAPYIQAAFIGGFTMLTVFGWSATLLFTGSEDLPPRSYYVIFVVILVVAWFLPFGAPRIIKLRSSLFAWLKVMTDWIANAGIKRSTVDPGNSNQRVVQMKPGQVFPVYQALSVYVLAGGMIAMFAWFTTYSGGPFESPFAQFLVALPLLSPVLTVRPGAVVATYLGTIATAVGFQYLATIDEMEGTSHLFMWAALGTLSVSGVVSYLNKRIQYKAYLEANPSAARSGGLAGLRRIFLDPDPS